MLTNVWHVFEFIISVFKEKVVLMSASSAQYVSEIIALAHIRSFFERLIRSNSRMQSIATDRSRWEIVFNPFLYLPFTSTIFFFKKCVFNKVRILTFIKILMYISCIFICKLSMCVSLKIVNEQNFTFLLQRFNDYPRFWQAKKGRKLHFEFLEISFQLNCFSVNVR